MSVQPGNLSQVMFLQNNRTKEARADLDIEMAGRLFLALNYVVMGGMV